MISGLLLWMLLSVLLDLTSATKVRACGISQGQLALLAICAVTATLEDLDDGPPVKSTIVRRGKFKTKKRVRRSVQSIFNEYGPGYVKRAYCMTEEAFWALHVLVKPYMVSTYHRPPGRDPKTHRKGSKNGIIPSETCLSAAVRYFAGGRPEDISISHGISHSEVFVSVWQVVDAVNECPGLAFGFPKCHDEQRKTALAFKEKSEIGIDCCVGAVDSLLIWIEKPSSRDCEFASCGAKKFFCGHKHKFGLNLQGTCDARGRFLDLHLPSSVDI
jgi:hypothetical protein